ncbi:MAG: mechanosensitive ion channel family protein [Armatimonadota bacterium]
MADFINSIHIDVTSYIINTVLPKSWAILKIIIFFLVVRYSVYGLIDKVLQSISTREGNDTAARIGRVKTLGSLIRSVFFYILIFISGVMLLRTFDIDPAPVLTAAGVVGLAVGFGSQKLVRDIIAGFFIVLENQYSVGDYITIGAVTGTVVELGMRVTRIRDDIGKLVFIANGDIIQVINHSRGSVQAILEVNLAPDSDLDKAREAINTLSEEIASKDDGILTAPKVVAITAITAASVTIRISAEVKPGKQESVQTALREAIYRKFREGEIKLV